MEPVYRGLFAGDEVHPGGADDSGSDDDAGAVDDALVVSSSRLLDAKTARLRELRARMLQERGEAAATVTAAPRPQRASLPMPSASPSSASSSSSFMRPGQGNLPAVSKSRDHPAAPALAHTPPLPAPSPPLPTSAASAPTAPTAPTASRDHLFFSLVPHADMQSASSTQSADHHHRDRDRGRGSGGGGGGEGGDRPSDSGAKRRRTASAAARSSASAEYHDDGDHERWQALQIVGRACQVFRDDDAAAAIHSGSHLVWWRGGAIGAGGAAGAVNDEDDEADSGDEASNNNANASSSSSSFSSSTASAGGADDSSRFTLDRYDARNLIESATALRKFRRFALQHRAIDESDAALSATDLAQLDVERYADLFEESRAMRREHETGGGAANHTGTGTAGDRAREGGVRYDYGADDPVSASSAAAALPISDPAHTRASKLCVALQAPPSLVQIFGASSPDSSCAASDVFAASTADLNYAFYVPPFAVPPHIPLPATAGQHQLIARTAAFVRARGGSAAAATAGLIFLRAKHARDRRFAFLFPEDPFPSATAPVAADSGDDSTGDTIGAVDSLHAYFRFLCDTGAAEAEADAQHASIELGSGGDWMDELLRDAQRWADMALQSATAATAAATAPIAAVSAAVGVVLPPIDAMAALADYADSDDDVDDDGKALAIAAKEAPAIAVGKWQHLLESQEESGISGSTSSSGSKTGTGAGSGSDASSLPRDPFAHTCDVLSAHPPCFALDCARRLECIVGDAPEGSRTPRQRLAYDLVSRLQQWMKNGP